MRLPFLLFLLFFFLPAAHAEQNQPTEPQVKAAYLYNFGKFVRWQNGPGKASATLNICVLGRDPFGSALDTIVAGESIEGKNIMVRRPAKIQDTAECNILFISVSEENRLGSILAAAQRLPILTVSDIPHFADRGGVIEFVLQKGKVRFEVNRVAAEQAHLVLSSELLKVASKVIDKTAERGHP